MLGSFACAAAAARRQGAAPATRGTAEAQARLEALGLGVWGFGTWGFGVKDLGFKV